MDKCLFTNEDRDNNIADNDESGKVFKEVQFVRAAPECQSTSVCHYLNDCLLLYRLMRSHKHTHICMCVCVCRELIVPIIFQYHKLSHETIYIAHSMLYI